MNETLTFFQIPPYDVITGPPSAKNFRSKVIK
jgi:hypothetical protein